MLISYLIEFEYVMFFYDIIDKIHYIIAIHTYSQQLTIAIFLQDFYRSVLLRDFISIPMLNWLVEQ